MVIHILNYLVAKEKFGSIQINTKNFFSIVKKVVDIDNESPLTLKIMDCLKFNQDHEVNYNTYASLSISKNESFNNDPDYFKGLIEVEPIILFNKTKKPSAYDVDLYTSISSVVLYYLY
jgi:hypothetical protein